MIVTTDVNGIIVSAHTGDAIETEMGSASGMYKITAEGKPKTVTGTLLSGYAIIETISTQTGTLDHLPRFKGRRRESINAACRNEIESGFTSAALGADHTYPSKEEDQTNLMATFVLAKELNASKPFKCWDAAGVADYRVHTVAQLHQVGQDAETHKMAALMKANTLKAQIAAATTLAEIEAIVW